MQRTRWLLGLTAIVLVTAFTVHPATPAAAQARYTFFQFNMAGNMNHGGHTELIVDPVVDSITSTWPTAISLNEVCENQGAEIYWTVNANGGGYHGYFAEMLPAGTVWQDYRQDGTRFDRLVCDGHAYGLALLIRGGDPQSFHEFLLPANVDNRPPAPGAEKHKAICGMTRASGPSPQLTVCSTHLLAESDAIQRHQMVFIAEWFLKPTARDGKAVAFLGDTYLAPVEMLDVTGRDLFLPAGQELTWGNPDCRKTKWAWRGWGHGYCPADRRTAQHDHVLVSKNRVDGRTVGGDATYTVWSDHLPLRGWATFR